MAHVTRISNRISMLDLVTRVWENQVSSRNRRPSGYRKSQLAALFQLNFRPGQYQCLIFTIIGNRPQQMMPIELTLVRPLVFTSIVVGWEIFVPWRPRRLCPLIYAAGHRREGVTLHQDWQKKVAQWLVSIF